MPHHRSRALFVALLATCFCALAALAAAPLHAQATRTWTGGGADNNWTTAANWGGTAPVAGDNLVFDATGVGTRPAPNNDFSAGTSFNAIHVRAAGYTLWGNSVTLTTGLTADTYASGTSTVSIDAIGGAGSVIKEGAGTLKLSQGHTFSGGVFLRAGKLNGRQQTSFGTGTITLGTAGSANATLLLGYGGNTSQFWNPIVLASDATGTLALESNEGGGGDIRGGVTGSNNLTLRNNEAFTAVVFSAGSVNNAGVITLEGTSANDGFFLVGPIGPNVTGLVQNSTTGQVTVRGALSVSAAGTTLRRAPGAAALTVKGGVTGTGDLILENNSATASGIAIDSLEINNSGRIVNAGTGAAMTISVPVGSNVTGITQASSASTLTVAGGLTVNSAGTTLTADPGAQGLTVGGVVSGTGNLILANNSATASGIRVVGTTNNSGTVVNTGTGAAVAINGPIGSNVTGVTQNSATSWFTIGGAVTVNATGTTFTREDVGGTSHLSVSGGIGGTGHLVLKNNSPSHNTLQFSGSPINHDGALINSGTGAGQTLISAQIGTNVDSVVQNGTSQLALTGNNTFTTGFFIRAGTGLGAGNANAFGAGTIRLGNTSGSAAASVLGYAGTFAQPIVLESGTTGVLSITSVNPSDAPTYTGGITGSNDLRIRNVGSGTFTFSTNPIDIAGTITNTSTGSGGIVIAGGVGSNVTAVVQAGTNADAGAALTLSGGLTVNGGGTTLSRTGSGPFVISGAIGGTGNLTLNNAGSSHWVISVSGAVDHSGALTNAGTGAPWVMITGVLGTNVTGVIQDGVSTLYLQGANTFTSGLTVRSGTVIGSTSASAFGAGAITLGHTTGSAAAKVQVSTQNLTIGNPIVLASGTTGTLTVGNYAGQPNIAFTGGVTGTNSFTIDNTGWGPITFSTGTVNNGGTITNAGTGTGRVEISAPIGASVTGVVQNSATSELHLSGANSFTSGASIQAGTLSGTQATSFGTGGAITLGHSTGSAPATLTVNSSVAVSRPIVLGGTTGALSINSSGGPTFSGGVTGTNDFLIQPIASGMTFSTSPINNTGSVSVTGILGSTVTLSGGIGANVTTVTADDANTGISGELVVNASGTTLRTLVASGQISLGGGVTGTGDLVLDSDGGSISISGSAVNHVGQISNTGSSGANIEISADVGSNVTGFHQASSTNHFVMRGDVALNAAGTTLRSTAAGRDFTLAGTVSGTGDLILQNEAAGLGPRVQGTLSFTGAIRNVGTGAGSAWVHATIPASVTAIEQSSATSSLLLSMANSSAAPITVTGGVLSVSHANALGDGSATNALTIAGGTLTVGTAMTSPATRPINLSGNATVSGSWTFTVEGPVTASGSLTKSGTNTLVLKGATSIAGDLVISAGVVEGFTGATIALGGKLTNNATFTANGGTVTLNGSAAQAVEGTAATTFANLTIDNPAGVTIAASPTIDGTLTLTSGKITTGSNKITLGAAASITGAGAGKYVHGTLERMVPNAAAPTLDFSIGDATAYAPVTVTFAGTTAGSGALSASTAAGDHASIATSGLDSTRSVNRWWTVANNGVTGFTSYDATFGFDAADLDAGTNTANFVVRKLDAGTWSTPTAGTRTGSSTQATGLTTFSDFAVGQMLAVGATVASTTPSSITEATVNGATIVLDITSGTFAATLGISNFELSDAPPGTSISGVSRESDTRITITLAHDGTDFDTDVALAVRVLQSALVIGEGPVVASAGTVAGALEVAASIQSTTPATLTEATLGGATITVDLNDAKWVATLTPAGFTLTSAPAGTSVGSVLRTSDTRAVLTLAFDGTDFDTTSSVAVQVEPSAIEGGSTAYAAGGAGVTPAPASSATIAGPASGVPNAVIGAVTITSVEPNGSAMAPSNDRAFALTSSSATGKFYSDAGATAEVTQVTIAATQSAATFWYRDTAVGARTLTATNDVLGAPTHALTIGSSSVTLASSPVSLTEGALNGATLTVDLANATYAAAIDAAGFELTSAPSGTSIGSASRSSDTRAVLTLAFDGTDFDTSATLTVNVKQAALATGSASSADVGVAPTAASAVALGGPTGAVPNSMTSVITLTVSEANGSTMPVAADRVFTLASGAATGTFYADAVGATEISQVTVPTGGATASFFYRDVAAGARSLTATNDVLGAANHAISVAASSVMVASTPASLTEGALNGATLTVDLANATYAATIDATSFELTSAPGGTSIGSASRSSDTRVMLTLAFDGTDFDTTATLAVNVKQSALATGAAASAPIAVAPDAATVVVIAGLATAAQKAVSAFTIATYEANGSIMPVAAANAFTLGASAGAGSFWSAADGTGAITSTSVPAGASQATFHYQDDEPGARNLTAAATGFITASHALTVQRVLTLAFGTLPDSVAVDMMMPALAVSAVDARGDVDTTFTGEIVLTLAAQPDGASIAGTLSAAAVKGVATFADLRLDTQGSGYQLGATPASGTAAAASSGTFHAYLPTVALSASLAVSSENPLVGETMTVTLTLTNDTDARAMGVVYDVPLPERAQFQAAESSQGSYDAATGLWTVGDIERNGSATLTITVVIKTGEAQ